MTPITTLEDDFAKRGRELAEELEQLSKNYHVKSDDHEILGYEAACVNARVALVTLGLAIPANLQESPLLGPWGRHLRPTMPAVANKVALFYEEFRRVSEPG